MTTRAWLSAAAGVDACAAIFAEVHGRHAAAVLLAVTVCGLIALALNSDYDRTTRGK